MLLWLCQQRKACKINYGALVYKGTPSDFSESLLAYAKANWEGTQIIFSLHFLSWQTLILTAYYKVANIHKKSAIMAGRVLPAPIRLISYDTECIRKIYVGFSSACNKDLSEKSAKWPLMIRQPVDQETQRKMQQHCNPSSERPQGKIVWVDSSLPPWMTVTT